MLIALAELLLLFAELLAGLLAPGAPCSVSGAPAQRAPGAVTAQPARYGDILAELQTAAAAIAHA